MAERNHVEMEFFPPRRLTVDLKRFLNKTIPKSFSTLSLVHFSTDKSNPNHQKKPHPKTKTKPLTFFPVCMVSYWAELRKTKAIMCKMRRFSGVNNFVRSLPRPEAHPTVTWICGSATGLVIKARAVLDSNENLPGNFSIFPEPSTAQCCWQRVKRFFAF